jgi:hypothetical protein
MARRSVWIVEAMYEGQRTWKPSGVEMFLTRQRAVVHAELTTQTAKVNGWKKWESRVVRYDASK